MLPLFFFLSDHTEASEEDKRKNNVKELGNCGGIKWPLGRGGWYLLLHVNAGTMGLFRQ